MSPDRAAAPPIPPADLEALALEITRDIAQGLAYSSRAERIGPDLATGYAVQDRVAARLLADGVRRGLAGYKVALNAPAAMARMGVKEPLSARLFEDQRCDSGADLRGKVYRQFAFEPEIAALIAQDLPPRAAAHDRAAVAGAVSRLVPALELLDPRGLDIAASSLPDVVAQNISNAGVVIGGPGVSVAEFDALRITTTVELDDRTVATVTDGLPQHPLDVVAWMADHLAARGLQLRSGMVVLCGSHTPIQHPGAARSVTVTMSGLGRVGVLR